MARISRSSGPAGWSMPRSKKSCAMAEDSKFQDCHGTGFTQAPAQRTVRCPFTGSPGGGINAEGAQRLRRKRDRLEGSADSRAQMALADTRAPFEGPDQIPLKPSGQAVTERWAGASAPGPRRRPHAT